MSAQVQQLRPRFKFGATVLEFPDPAMDPAAAILLYVPNYPFLATARIGTPVVESEFLTYPVTKPDVQVKGSAKSATPRAKSKPDPLAAIDTWLAAPASAPEHAILVGGAMFGVAVDVLRRAPTPLSDAMLIPLA